MQQRSDQSVAFHNDLYSQRQLTQKVDDLYKQIEALKNQLAQARAENQSTTQQILNAIRERETKTVTWVKRQCKDLIGELAKAKEDAQEQIGTIDFRLDEIEALAQKAGQVPKAIARMRTNIQGFFADLDAIADPSLPDNPDWQALPEPEGEVTSEFTDFPIG